MLRRGGALDATDDGDEPCSPRRCRRDRERDRRAGACALDNLGVNLPHGSDTAYWIEWRTGARSVIGPINLPTGPWPGSSDPPPNFPMVIYPGEGGGRWYSNTGEGAYRPSFTTPTESPQFRGLLVDGTSNPLRIYHANPELLNREEPNDEIRNTKDSSTFTGERTPNFRLTALVTRIGSDPSPGSWHIVDERTTDGAHVLTAPFDRPVLYRRGFPTWSEIP